MRINELTVRPVPLASFIYIYGGGEVLNIGFSHTEKQQT